MPARLAVVQPQFAFDLVSALATQCLRPRLCGQLQAVGGMRLLPGSRVAVCGIQPGVLVPTLVEVVRMPIRCGNENDLRQRVCQAPQTCFAGSQLLLRLGPLHGFPAACRDQADQFDLGRQPASRCALMHADRRDQAAVFVQRNGQRCAQAGAAILLCHIVRCTGRGGIGGEPRAIFQQGIAQSLRHFQWEIALQARHVLHVVADHVHGLAVRTRQTERTAIGLQMFAEQTHAGVDDLTWI